MMLIVRRVTFVITVIFARDHLFFQLAAQNFTALGMMIFLQWYKPLDSKQAVNVETFNECTMLLLTYHLICFTDFVPDPAMRSDLGLSYIYTNFTNIGFHVVLMLGTSISGVKTNCRRKMLRKKNLKEHQKRIELQKAKQAESMFNNNLIN